MTKPWSAEEIAKICSARITGNPAAIITGFSIDTRTIKPGDLFVALKGENQDGHRFVGAAIKGQAAAVLVSEDIPEIADSTAVIKVNDTLKALQILAASHRQTFSGTRIGVTGSNGKTTTRSMLHHLLSANNICEATSGNLNNHIGLPLTLLSVNPASEYVVLEMGMNHLGEIRELCDIARPQISLISNIGPAHIGILGSLQNIARAKAEILEGLTAEQTAVVPGDTEFTDLFRASTPARLFTFGENPACNYRIVNLHTGIDEVNFELHTGNEKHFCRLSLAGRHNAFNAAAAMALYHQLGHNLADACRIISSYRPVGARMEKFVIDGVNILLDCYNANPGSMAEALKYLAICPAPRIAVLGDMRELGDMSEDLHRELGEKAALAKPEYLVCFGKDTGFTAETAIKHGMKEENVRSFISEDQAAEHIKGLLRKDSTILFKASRGMYLEKIVRKIWPELGQGLH